MNDKNSSNLVPEEGTEALLNYFWADYCDWKLFGHVVDLTIRSDFTSHIADQALNGEALDKEITPGKLAENNPGPATLALRKSRQELLEMFLSRMVDNFTAYLVDIIRIKVHKQPRILSNNKLELSLEHILKFDSIEALSSNFIEGKINSLTYEGFGKIEDWCQDRGIPLNVTGENKKNN